MKNHSGQWLEVEEVKSVEETEKTPIYIRYSDIRKVSISLAGEQRYEVLVTSYSETYRHHVAITIEEAKATVKALFDIIRDCGPQ